MNGQPATYFTVTLNERVMYRTDNVFGGTYDEAQQRAREVAAMIRQQNPNSQIRLTTSGLPR